MNCNINKVVAFVFTYQHLFKILVVFVLLLDIQNYFVIVDRYFNEHREQALKRKSMI